MPKTRLVPKGTREGKDEFCAGPQLQYRSRWRCRPSLILTQALGARRTRSWPTCWPRRPTSAETRCCVWSPSTRRPRWVEQDLGGWETLFQTVAGCRVRMDRRRFRDFMQDNLDISSELLSDRIFRFFNKVSQTVCELLCNTMSPIGW